MPYVALLAATIAVVVAVIVYVRLSDQQDRFFANAVRVRSQNCKLFEADHLRDVVQLRQTYAYLEQLHKDEFDDPINRFVVARLSETEATAHHDSAPDYCDNQQPNGKPYGLPEPDPVVPDRPQFLR